MESRVSVIFLLFLILTCITFCSGTRVPTGSIGIVSSLDKTIQTEPASPGFHITILDSIEKVDITEVRVNILGETPKDKDKIKLNSVDTVITYKVEASKAVSFYIQTKELDKVDGEYVLGYDIMKTEGVSAISEAFLTMSGQAVIVDKPQIQNKVKDILQHKLDERYPGVFKIVNVNVNKVLLDPMIENILQQQSSVENEKKLLDLKEELVRKQNNNLRMEMEGIKTAASAMGITSDKLLEYRAKMDYNNALRELSKSPGTQVQVKGE